MFYYYSTTPLIVLLTLYWYIVIVSRSKYILTKIANKYRFMRRSKCGTLTAMIKQIAIDGPVASGKTTIGRQVSQSLNWRFLDTGLMYRAATWLVLKESIPLDNEEEMVTVTSRSKMELKILNGTEILIVNDEDVTEKLRTFRIEKTVSQVSKVRGVREALVSHQRQIASEGPIVMVGRDIGTVVLIDAPLKIYLDASIDLRAYRRYCEMSRNGDNVTLDLVKADIIRRDRTDSGRTYSPLRPANDAIVIDTTASSVEEVANTIVGMVDL